MRIIHINTNEIPCPGSHHYTVTKLCRGFEQNGFEFIELKNLEDVEKYNDKNNLIILSDHFHYIGTYDQVYSLGKKLDQCVFIAWHFNFYPELINNMPFKKYILTGEYYRNPPLSSDTHKYGYSISLSSENWVPFIFSSSLHPNEVGGFTRSRIYDSCFIGAPYKQDWIAGLNNCYSYFSDSSTKFLNEKERIDVYKNSLVCLGFHSDANVLNSCVTERVFEGMSFGCAVISDNKAAEECTDGLVKYVTTPEEVNYYIDLYKNNNDLFNETQKKGYDYIRDRGTYFHLAKMFIDKIAKLY